MSSQSITRNANGTTLIDRGRVIRFAEECAATGDALLVRLADSVCDGDGELQEGVVIGRRRDGDAHFGGLLLIDARSAAAKLDSGIEALSNALADASGEWSLAAVSPEAIVVARCDVERSDMNLETAPAAGALRFARAVLRETARWSALGFERSHRAAKAPRQDEFWLILAERWAAPAAERGAAPEEVEAATEWLKRRGNAHFGGGRHAIAARLYEAAILDLERDGSESEGLILAPLLSNLAAAQHQLQRYRAAAATARRCTVANPRFAKGYFRRARALLALAESTGDASAARDALVAAQAGCTAFPDNKSMVQQRDKVLSFLYQASVGTTKATSSKAKATSKSKSKSKSKAAADAGGEGEDEEDWYTLEPAAVGSAETRVVFDCAAPAGAAPSPELLNALIARPIHARGGRFELTIGRRAGTVECVFESPRPEGTARAIATRLKARAEDPTEAADAANAACAVC